MLVSLLVVDTTRGFDYQEHLAMGCLFESNRVDHYSDLGCVCMCVYVCYMCIFVCACVYVCVCAVCVCCVCMCVRMCAVNIWSQWVKSFT